MANCGCQSALSADGGHNVSFSNELEIKYSWPHLRYFCGVCIQEIRTFTKEVRIIGIQAETIIDYILNKSEARR
jgi:hypothetical protein